MIIKLKNGDTYLDVDTDFPDCEIDTLELRKNEEDMNEDTLELSLDKLNGDIHE